MCIRKDKKYIEEKQGMDYNYKKLKKGQKEMKLKKCFFVILLFAFWVILFSNKSFAGTQRWNNLDYDVTLNSDGSMDVVETWDVYISETNTMFKDFNLDPTKYSGITNVSVMQTYPEKVELAETYKEEYHVKPGCYYGLVKEANPNVFEIAWNVGLDNSSATRTYQIRYRIKDAVKIYNDCTELYWMFLGTENTMEAKNVTGTVKLPKAVSNLEKLRVWGHGPFQANINKKSTDTVVFDCKDLYANEMLEIRIVTEENIYDNCYNKVNMSQLDSILSEEQEWADEANAKRKRARAIWFVVDAIIVAFLAFMFKKALDYINEGKELDAKYSRIMPDLKYFRDIPDEKNASPANAIYMYDAKNNGSSVSDSKIPQAFSATMLDLALKGFLEFEPIDNKNFNIIFKKDHDEAEALKRDEKAFYDILRKASKGEEKFTSKDLLKYTKSHYESLHSTFSQIGRIVEDYQIKKGNLDKERKEVNKKWSEKSGLYLLLIIVLLFFGFPIIGASLSELHPGNIFLYGLLGIFGCFIILSFICARNAKKVSVFSDQGAEEVLQWKGLCRYMKEFSLLKDKEVPDLILWEKFLVYATAFGISKEVIKQLKVVYPQMSDPDFYSNSNYRYMYYMTDSRFGENFVNTLNNAMTSAIRSSQNAYNAAHSADSSGSGGGGGFSGGGGGGGGGGRMRW